MPTENRSSNTEMVSVPRDEIELTIHCLRMAGETSSADELQVHLDRPAEQCKGEPAVPAFVMPSNENSYGFGYVDGTCIQSLRGYRDHLEEIVDSIPEGPLYTHADPGAAERLVAANTEFTRRHLAQLDEIQQLRAQLAERDAQIDTLAAKVVERGVLLRGVFDSCALWLKGHQPTADTVELQERIGAALSAKAEPEAKS